MSRHVFVAEQDELRAASPGSVIALTGPEGHHAAVVRRVRVGESVDVVDGRGRRVVGVVTAVERGVVGIEVGEVADEPVPDPRLMVVQALAKGERSELAVELLTEVGVDGIVPWSAQRSVVVWKAERAERGLRRWTSAAREAGKQSRRARFPEIAPLARTDDLVARIAAAELALVLHESATLRLSGMSVPRSGEVLVIVGPEGGISEEEIAVLGSAGAIPVRLGDSVLRTSSAGSAAAAVILAASGRWD